jgi:hypothetical protein
MFYIYNGSLTLDSNVTLKGHASNTLPLVFVRDSFAFLTMKAGAKITGNTNASTSVPGSGVSVNINGTFTMNGGEISGNTDSFGGGVAVLGGSFTMNDGKISGNTAQHGGGVAVWTTFTMKGGEISDNTGAAAGAGVWVGTSAIFTMSGTAKITGNTARASGSHKGHSGGVHVWGGAFTMSGGTISGNTADGVGGGVNVGDSEDEDGSMLANGTFTMSGGTISNNTASDSGGGVHVSDGDFTMEDGTISGNISSDNGGGVQVGDGTFTMEDGTISGNTAPMGGGVFVDDGDFTMEDGTISDNTASMIGGGVGVVGGTVAMDAGTISGNTALYGGGVGIIGANSGMGITGGNFDKTGGTIYGDTDSNPNNSNAEDNTATSTEGGAFWGHAVLYLADFTVGGDGNLIPATWYYRNETLNTTDAISTSTLPASGTGDNWTKVEM